MINVDELIPGQYYFFLVFEDSVIEIPIIETYVFLTKVNDEFFFQDPASYIKYGSCYKKTRKKKCVIISADKDVVSHYDDIDGLVEKLLKLKQGKL